MKPEPVLIDTSAWILSFRKSGHPELKRFVTTAITVGAVATTPVIIMELLQGCRSQQERDRLRDQLESLNVLPIDQPVWSRAYQLGFSLRRKGVSIPTVDLIIGSVAIEYSCLILHQDKHFEMIAAHSTLKAKSFGG